MSVAFIETRRLHYAYRQESAGWHLADVDIRIHRGEYVLLCGASGSGKSTLCRTFNGLIPHFYGGRLEGDVRIDGVSTRRQTVAGLFDRVGMVFQNPEAQLFNRTVEGEIAFGLESLSLPRAEIRKRLHGTAEALGITDLLPLNPHLLSGGQQQLVAIAAALALKPTVIVLDEPYANLDAHGVRRVCAVLQRIHRQGTAVVVAEHRLGAALPDARRIMVMASGRLALDGTVQTVLAKDLTAFGLEIPQAAAVSRRLGLRPICTTMDQLRARLAEKTETLPAARPALPPPAAHGGRPLLAVRGLSYAVGGRPILEDVGFELNAGECVAVVGGNGAGKTTLLKLLMGLRRPSGGRILLNGKETARWRVSTLARHMGLAFQNPNNQFFKMTVWDEIQVGAQALDCYDEAWLNRLVRLFGLAPLLKRSPFRLSGGEKKRVAFAAALAARPTILALDEPTSGQDGRFRQALGELLVRLQQDGQSVLMVTHDLNFAERHARRWLVLGQGRVLADGPPDHIMAQPDLMRRAGLEPTDGFIWRRIAASCEGRENGWDSGRWRDPARPGRPFAPDLPCSQGEACGNDRF